MSDSEYIYCQNCGARIPASVKFCDKCGTKNEYSLSSDGSLVKTAPQEAPVSPAPAPAKAPSSRKKILGILCLILAAVLLITSGIGIGKILSGRNGNNDPVQPDGNTNGAPAIPPIGDPAPSDGVIGCVIIEDGPIHIRTKASTDGEVLGNASNAEAYDVYETATGGGYTWYRIGEGRWIASNGKWARFVEGGRASQYPPEKILAGSYRADVSDVSKDYRDILTLNENGTCSIKVNMGSGMTEDKGTYYVSEGLIYITLPSDSYLMQYYGWNSIKVSHVVFDIYSITCLELKTDFLYTHPGDYFNKI